MGVCACLMNLPELLRCSVESQIIGVQGLFSGIVKHRFLPQFIYSFFKYYNW